MFSVEATGCGEQGAPSREPTIKVESPSPPSVSDSGPGGWTVATAETPGGENAYQPRQRISTKGIRRPGYKRRVSTPCSYVELISSAIKASPNCMLTLREILAFMQENNECFQGSYVGWKNSVRHNLSSSSCFVKLLRNRHKPFGKDNFWAMNPDCVHCASSAAASGSSTSRQKPLSASLKTNSPGSSPSSPGQPPVVAPVPVRHWQRNYSLSADGPASPPQKAPGGEASPTPDVASPNTVTLNAGSPGAEDQMPIDLTAGVEVSSQYSLIRPEQVDSFSTAGDDDPVQEEPLDLSTSKRSPRDQASPALHPVIMHGIASAARPELDSRHAGFRSRGTGHSLPVSRFLNPPDDGGKGTSYLYAATRYSPDKPDYTSQPSSASSSPILLDLTEQDRFQLPMTAYPIPGKLNTASPLNHNWNSLPQGYAPSPATPGDLREIQNLYEHYWSYALTEKEALYRQHLAMPYAGRWHLPIQQQYLRMNARIL